MLIYFLLFFILTINCLKNEKWDINYPCDEYVKNLAKTESNFAYCATLYSAPPKVCTNCIQEYISFKQTEYATYNLNNVFSIDNKSCSTVIYTNYLLSYGNEISNSLTQKIWKNSRCESCLLIHWDLKDKNSTIFYDNKTLLFEKNLYNWRNCINQINNTNKQNFSVCNNCQKYFDDLFDYYWKIYTASDTDFCIDVESTMNDTMNIWHNVWQCPDDIKPVGRHNDITVVACSAAFLAIFIAFFYAGSYCGAEKDETNLVQYSHLIAPRSRYRLLSSSITVLPQTNQ